MRLFKSIVVALAIILMASTVNTEFTSLERINIVVATDTSQTYCASTNATLTNAINTAAGTVCSSISNYFAVAAANATSGECSCQTWSLGATKAVACNCNSCAPLQIDNFDSTCTGLVRKCMVGEEPYHGGYVTKSGEGYLGYLAVYADGGFGHPELTVSCPDSVDGSTDKGNIDVPVLALPKPGDIPELVEKLLKLNFTYAELFPDHVRNQEEAKALLAKVEETEAKIEAKQAEIEAIQDKMEKEKAEQEEKEAAEAEETEAEQEKNKAAGAPKVQKGEAKKKAAEAKKIQKAEDKRKKAEERRKKKEDEASEKALRKANKKFGGYEGLSDKLWMEKIAEEKKAGMWAGGGMDLQWQFEGPIHKALCLMGHRYSCVLVARVES